MILLKYLLHGLMTANLHQLAVMLFIKTLMRNDAPTLGSTVLSKIHLLLFRFSA
jgi:hypothetical protein